MRVFLVVPALLVAFFVFQIFRPFFLPIALAATFASLFYPLYKQILVRLGNRPNLAALLTCFLITAVIMVPLVFLLVLLTNEVRDVYAKFQAQTADGELQELLRLEGNPYAQPVLDWIGKYLNLAEFDVTGSLSSAFQQVSLFFIRHSTAILGGAVQVISDFFIMLVTMYFFFRDGRRIGEEVKSWTPLSARYERLLISTFREVSRATILGSVATALAQGAAGWLVFLLLGIPNSLFWGAAMAILSLVPLVGTALVWVPWAIYLFATGSITKGIILVILSSLFVGMMDNFLRPLLIEGRSGMHTLLVFFAIMGGIGYFGMSGLIFGPLLVSLGLTFLELYKIEFKEIISKPQR